MTTAIQAYSTGTNAWVTIGVTLIAAAAALIGAAVAAVTAGRRQRRELAHDRDLAEVTELRTVLDAAARHIASADRTMGRAHHQARSRGLPASDDDKKPLDEPGDLMSDSLQQIRIRLGRGDALTAYEEAWSAYDGFKLVIRAGDEYGDGLERLIAERSSFEHACNDFFDAAYSMVGVRVSPVRVSRRHTPNE